MYLIIGILICSNIITYILYKNEMDSKEFWHNWLLDTRKDKEFWEEMYNKEKCNNNDNS